MPILARPYRSLFGSVYLAKRGSLPSVVGRWTSTHWIDVSLPRPTAVFSPGARAFNRWCCHPPPHQSVSGDDGPQEAEPTHRLRRGASHLPARRSRQSVTFIHLRALTVDSSRQRFLLIVVNLKHRQELGDCQNLSCLVGQVQESQLSSLLGN